MAAPLAVVLLLSAARAFAAGGACPVPLVDKDLKPLPFSEASPDCAAARAMLPDYARLRAAAGIPAEKIQLVVLKEESINAAFHHEGPWKLAVNAGLLHARKDRASTLFVIAHELGHAVQQSGPEGVAFARMLADLRADKSDDAGAAIRKALGFKRRYEAQADVIAEQMLVAAGFSDAAGRVGIERFFGCNASELSVDHPGDAQRFRNAALSQEYVARIAKAKAAVRGVSFDARTDPGAVRAGGGTLKPAAKLSDFTDRGDLKIGRFVASDLRLPVPPPSSGRFTRTVNATMQGWVDRWLGRPLAAAVDATTEGTPMKQKVLKMCGTPQAQVMSADTGVYPWIKRIARDRAERVARWFTGS